jgi:acetolactate synthase-1/2/3 large subunit
MAALEDLLAQSQRPMLILGGGRWSETALGHRPLCGTLRRAGLHVIPARPSRSMPCIPLCRRSGLGRQSQTGGAGESQRPGDRRGRGSTNSPPRATACSTFPCPDETGACLSGAEEIGRVYRPHLGIHAAPQAFAAATTKLRRDAADAAPRIRIIWIGPNALCPSRARSTLPDHDLAASHLPADAILCNGAGNYSAGSTASSLPPLQYPDGDDMRLHGLWRARFGGDESLYPGARCLAINGDGDF